MPKLENIEITATSAKKKSRVESSYARFDPRNRSGSTSRYFWIPWLTSNSEQTKSYDLSKSAIFLKSMDFLMRSVVFSTAQQQVTSGSCSPARPELQKYNFVSIYAPVRTLNHAHIVPELALYFLSMC